MPTGIPEKLSPNNRAKIARKIGGKWKVLARALDFDAPHIQTIEADHPYDQQGAIISMLDDWVSRHAGEDLLGMLVGALKDDHVGLNGVVLEFDLEPEGQRHATTPPQEGASGPAQPRGGQRQGGSSGVNQSINVVNPSGPVNIGHTHDCKFYQQE